MNKTAMLKTALSAIFCVMAFGNLAFGQFLPGGGKNLPSDQLPPDGVYLSPDDVHAMYSGPGLTIVLKAVQHQPFAHDKSQGPGPADETEVSDTSMDGMVSVNGGGFVPSHATGPMTTVVTNKNSVGIPFPTEMISLTLTAVTPGFPNVFIRESPTLQSLGQTKITPIGGGMYHIDSFFDVFTELSFDNSNWFPDTAGPVRMNLVPEPASLVMFGLGAIGCLAVAIRRRRK